MIVRLLLWAILGFLVYTAVTALKRTLSKPPGPPPAKTRGGEEMVQDPVCGTYVPRGDALTLHAAGREHHFCSEACRRRFQEPH